MKHRNRAKLFALVMISTLSLTACAFIPTPKEDRYTNIDKTLELIDYKTVGPIIKEEIDNGDGLLSPSYKDVYYGVKSGDELERRLKTSIKDCAGTKANGMFYCSYSHTSIDVYYKKSDDTTVMRISDSSNGRY